MDMPRVESLVKVLHRIDELRGKFCATCEFYRHGGLRCLKGYRPMGVNDGCDDWTEWQKPTKAEKALAEVVGSI